jgi:hypothetical protein
MIVTTDLFTSWVDFGGDMESYSVRTSCVIPLKHLVTALWLMLTERVKRLVATSQIQLAFALERLQTFLRWITRANDDQP